MYARNVCIALCHWLRPATFTCCEVLHCRAIYNYISQVYWSHAVLLVLSSLQTTKLMSITACRLHCGVPLVSSSSLPVSTIWNVASESSQPGASSSMIIAAPTTTSAHHCACLVLLAAAFVCRGVLQLGSQSVLLLWAPCQSCFKFQFENLSTSWCQLITWPHCCCRHIAAAEGAFSVCKWLLDSGADANALDRFQRTALEVRSVVAQCMDMTVHVLRMLCGARVVMLISRVKTSSLLALAALKSAHVPCRMFVLLIVPNTRALPFGTASMSRAQRGPHCDAGGGAGRLRRDLPAAQRPWREAH
jgi:hypothetical protein